VTEENQYHDNESTNVIDLFNAVHGAFQNGQLDVNRLDTLSEEEKQDLDIQRLKDIWSHVKAGCSRCQTIITELSLIPQIAMAVECAQTENTQTAGAAKTVHTGDHKVFPS
jgi:hypothetical protein